MDRFTRKLVPLVLSGPPGATSYNRPSIHEVVAYFGTLLPRQEIRTRVEVIE